MDVIGESYGNNILKDKNNRLNLINSKDKYFDYLLSQRQD